VKESRIENGERRLFTAVVRNGMSSRRGVVEAERLV